MTDTQADLFFAFAALLLAGGGVAFWIECARRRKARAAAWAAQQLRRNGEHLQALQKTYLQQEARSPYDAKTRFMLAHLNRQIEQHNGVADRIKGRLQ